MFQSKVIFFIFVVSLVEFTTQEDKLKEETLAAARRGDIPSFRRGINKGGLKSYGNNFKNYSEQEVKEIDSNMNGKLHAIERLIDSNLVVPANKEQPTQNQFNVTIIRGTDIISELSLNLEALDNWKFKEKPLHILCALPDVEPRIVKVLLDKGLDINENSKTNYTPVEIASYNGNLPLVKFLVENGADINRTVIEETDEFDRRNYHKFISIFSKDRLRAPKGSKYHHNILVTAIYSGNKEIVKYLLSRGADINVSNQSSSALFSPVFEAQPELLEILLQNGCDVNAQDYMGMSALHLAADKGYLEIIKILLKYGANVKSVDRFGWTPLHVAAFSAHNASLVELLIEAGASIDAKTDEGFTPLILAEAGSDPSFLDCLSSAIARNFSTGLQCQPETTTHKDNIPIITLLCNKGANANHKDDAIGWTVLHWAGAIGDDRVAKFLVEKCKASVDSRSKAGMLPFDVVKYFGRSIQIV